MTIPRIDSLDRNFLINGGFDFFQRSLSTVTVDSAASYYAPDRWNVTTFNQAFTVKRSTNLPLSSRSKYSFEINTVSPIGGSDRSMRVRQRIESVFARQLSNKIISLRGFYNSVSADTMRIVINSPTVENDYGSVTNLYDQTFSIANDSSWNDFKLENFSLGNVDNGLEIQIWFQNTVNLVSGSHYLADIKLNIGTTAQEFSLAGRDLVEELQLCQRYYQIVKGTNADNGAAAATKQYYAPVNFKTEMRVTPTITATPIVSTLVTSRSPIYESAFGFVHRTIASGSNSMYDVTDWTADSEL